MGGGRLQHRLLGGRVRMRAGVCACGYACVRARACPSLVSPFMPPALPCACRPLGHAACMHTALRACVRAWRSAAANSLPAQRLAALVKCKAHNLGAWQVGGWVRGGEPFGLVGSAQPARVAWIIGLRARQ